MIDRSFDRDHDAALTLITTLVHVPRRIRVSVVIILLPD